MADHTAPSTSSASPTSVETARPAPGPSSTRMMALLALLGIMVGWYAYDFFVAKPQTLAAEKAIQDLADERNKQGIKAENGESLGDGRVTSADIQKAIGRAPYSTKVEKNYTVETYWWYSMPHRNYITVLYVGNDPRRYNTHYRDSQPHPDDLPTDIELTPAKGGDGEALQATSINESGEPGGSGDSKKAKDEPAKEAPAAKESQEEKSAQEKPADEKP